MVCVVDKMALVVACGATTLVVTMSDAGAVDLQSSLRDRQMQIEQSIRRNYNAQPHINAQRPTPYRFRERHLSQDSLVVPGARVPASCAYQYRRWQRSGSSYWQDRYFDCAG